jgi:transposase
VVFEDYLLTVEHAEARREALDEQLERFSQEPRYRAPVAALRLLPGDRHRHRPGAGGRTARAAPLRSPAPAHGLPGTGTPRGKQRRPRTQGGITGAGNRHVRRLLVEAAWHYRHKPLVGRGLRLRWRGQPPAVLALADRALRRLTLRQRRTLHQGKHPNLVTVAIARELVGFIWNALQATVPARA